eukprot:TRINITY_DN150_c0_g1_i2.p1 TRINITY_DN150_c0_g1~~TRINITY_DN150_c0_g1_i2.p1  ORF type:complete len:604 (+),score=159.55 TRINITY_DN150_c0_g1_i2:40-1851(+)
MSSDAITPITIAATTPTPTTTTVNAGTGAESSMSSEQLKKEFDELEFLAPEVEEGNVEYKRALVNPTEERLQQLTSQLKWRLREGNGEALYEIGTEDDGTPLGLCEEDLKASLANLKTMADNLGAEVSMVLRRKGMKGDCVQMLVRELRVDEYTDVRIAVCGNVDAGKSTLVGVLTTGNLDDGRGDARVNMFNHRHELESGRTSSIGEQIMGFNAKGECVNYSDLHKMTWGDIIENSCKIVSFLDLAGHQKYLKTTVQGMTASLPDYALLLVGANMGVTKMTKEHLGLALAMKIPLIVVVTKVDICPPNILSQTMADIDRILKMRGVRKMPVLVKNEEDLHIALNTITNPRMVPVFQISSVTGLNLPLLRQFLNIVPARIQWNLLRDKPAEVLIDNDWWVQGVGTVAGGIVMSGSVSVGDTLLLLPDSNGGSTKVVIKSIQVRRRNVKVAYCGQTAGFALKKIKRSQLRKGMVMIAPEVQPQATWTFEADVIVLYHSTTMKQNYTPFVQCLSIRQTARLVSIEKKEVLRTGDRARVTLKFLYHPEYLKPGMRLIFREGACKGIGIVAKVNHDAVPLSQIRARGYVKSNILPSLSPAPSIKVSQ